MVDILSRKYVEEYIVVLSTVETDFGDKIKWESPSDPVYQNLVFVKSKFVVIGWRMTYYFDGRASEIHKLGLRQVPTLMQAMPAEDPSFSFSGFQPKPSSSSCS